MMRLHFLCLVNCNWLLWPFSGLFNVKLIEIFKQIKYLQKIKRKKPRTIDFIKQFKNIYFLKKTIIKLYEEIYPIYFFAGTISA